MTLIQSRAVSLSSSDLIKMEERKRPASHDHDNTEPPFKRQATSVNGAPKGHIDADMPWKNDLEVSKPCDFWHPFDPLYAQRYLSRLLYTAILDLADTLGVSSNSRRRPYTGRCKNISGKETV